MLLVRTLGGLSMHRDGRALSGAATQPRRLAVLALLARAGERGVTRDRLLSLLWPDADEEAGRRALTQALFAIRRELGVDELFTGVQELRLNADVARADVVAFERACAAREWEKAIDAYDGPFLDGFRLAGAADFERWADEERAALAHRHRDALERLARGAAESGDLLGAVGWWRRVAALDPLNARTSVELMKALDAAGDRAGALQHARIHEVLAAEELDAPPDREVVALAARLRAASAASVPVAPPTAAPPVPAVAVAEPERFSSYAPPVAAAAAAAAAAVEPPSAAGAPPRVETPTPPRRGSIVFRVSRRRLRVGAIAAVAMALVALGVGTRALLRRGGGTIGGADGRPVIAVGLIADFRTERGGVARPLADMLATNLARADGLQVVSPARLLELLRQLGAADTSAGAVVSAARRAGATELVEGTLFAQADGTLRLDLRRVDIASGAVRASHTIAGSDPFAVADSGTARLVADLGVAAPRGSIADVTTRSEVAYRFYDQGVRAWYAGRREDAQRLLEEALRADSSFAMAAYYRAIVVGDLQGGPAGALAMRRAAALAERASERERLLIKVGRAAGARQPALRVLAESLTTRYPGEIEGHLHLGHALVIDGDYAGARAAFERVVAMDSLGLRGASTRCIGCRAMATIVGTYVLTDSTAAAEREARRWLRLQSRDPEAWMALARALAVAGRWPEADRAIDSVRALAPGHPAIRYFAFARALRTGAPPEAERIAREDAAGTSGVGASDGLWRLMIALRHQGRIAEVQRVSREYLRVRAAQHAADRAAGHATGPMPRTYRIAEALGLLEGAQPAAAAAVFEDIAQAPGYEGMDTLSTLRTRAWMLLHAATARAAAGDTARLAVLARDIAAAAREAGTRDPQYEHYPAALQAAARGDTARAIAELRAAISSPTLGYSVMNLALARLLLATGRPAEAVAALQPALRGEFEAANLYVTHTALHEALAQAWDARLRTGGPAAGAARDSAATHYRWVAGAWKAGDAPFAARAQAAAARAAVIAGS